MAQRSLDTNLIEEILQKTMEALSSSKLQIFDIAESARNEYNGVKADINELKQDIAQIIGRVDKLEIAFKQVRQRLMEVSRNFDRYHENEKQQVYEQADKIREELTIAREREKYLAQRRADLEQRLVRVGTLVNKAEQMVSQVGVALEFLNGSMSEISSQLEGIHFRFQLGQKVIRAQEEERRRVAREIHDGPAQDLANVVLKAEICEKMFLAGRAKELTAELADLKVCVKTSLQEVRKIIYNLRPMALDDLGLIPALKRYIEEYQLQTGIATKLMVWGKDVRFDSVIEVAVFRVIQEALSNSRKYARPTEIKVKVEFRPEQLNAVIEDDGIGFDMEEVEKRIVSGEHFGLFGMRERMDLLDGSISIVSKPNQGARIGLKIPLETSDGGK